MMRTPLICRWFLRWPFLFSLILLMASVAGAEAGDSERIMTASWSSSSPAGFSGELGLGRLFLLRSDHDFWVGPRVGVLWNAQGLNEFNFPLGVQGELWLGNVLGIGIRTEVVVPYFSELKPLSFRISPQVMLRVFHLGETGALAVQMALPYDTVQKWYFQLGLTLQLGGLSQSR